MGGARMYPLSSDFIQSQIDLYMSKNAGREITPDSIMDICGDRDVATNELERWQSRHKDDSSLLESESGGISVKVYFSIKQDPEQVVIRDKWKKRRGKR